MGSEMCIRDRPVEARKRFVLDALEQHEQPLTRYAHRICRSKLGQSGDAMQMARDAVQHTFMKLCQQPLESVAEKVAPWLFTVCRNRILDQTRSHQRREKQSSGETEFDFPDSRMTDPAAQIEKADLLDWIAHLITRLPDAQRQVVELWSHGLPHKEIAKIVGENPGAVRVKLHRAIKQLRTNPEVESWLQRASGQIAGPNLDHPESSKMKTVL